jgi:hypothetical protein
MGHQLKNISIEYQKLIAQAEALAGHRAILVSTDAPGVAAEPEVTFENHALQKAG